MSIQQLVSQIKDLSSKPLGQLVNVLKQAESQLQQGAQQSAGVNIQQAINVLSPQEHTLGCVFLLNAWGAVGVPQGGNELLVDAIRALFEHADARQLQAAPDRTSTLAGHLRDQVLAMQQPWRAVVPLRMALQKLAPTPEHITPIHAMFFQCCLLAKVPGAAVPILQQEVFDVDPAKTGMTPRDFLLYCYYGGLVHIARKRYPQALEALLAALTAPTMVTNAITVAAWKKWALVNLIHNGKLPSLPRWIPPAVSRAARQEGAAYQDLDVAYAGKSATVMAETVTKHQAEFVQEDNMGLVKLVVESQTKRNVQRLTQTYLTLSLANIASAVGLPSAADAEVTILRMIDAGEVFAEIDAEKGMVRFLEDPQQYRGTSTLAALDAHIQRATQLAACVAATDHQVSMDKAYLQKVHMKERPWQMPRDMSDLSEEPSDFGVSEPPPPPSLSQFSTPSMQY